MSKSNFDAPPPISLFSPAVANLTGLSGILGAGAGVSTKEEVEIKNDRARSWSDLTKGNICIGEYHDDISSKKFLIDNMFTFKVQGINTIFLEHLSQKEHQEDIDKYLLGEEMSESLTNYLNELNEGHMNMDIPIEGVDLKMYSELKKEYNFTSILFSAKVVGIKVVALEKSLEDYRSSGRKSGSYRISNFNYNAVNIIKEHSKDSKWIAFVGNSHVNEAFGIAGVAQIIPDVQDIMIFDDNKIESPEYSFFKIKERIDKDGKSIAKGKPIEKDEKSASIVIRAPMSSNMYYDPSIEPKSVFDTKETSRKVKFALPVSVSEFGAICPPTPARRSSVSRLAATGTVASATISKNLLSELSPINLERPPKETPKGPPKISLFDSESRKHRRVDVCEPDFSSPLLSLRSSTSTPSSVRVSKTISEPSTRLSEKDKDKTP